MGKVSFNDSGIEVEKIGKFMRRIADFPTDFLTTAIEFPVFRDRLKDIACNWAKDIVLAQLSNYPHPFKARVYRSKQDICAKYEMSSLSMGYRHIKPVDITCRNTIHNLIEITIDVSQGQGLAPTHLGLIMVSPNGYFSWDLYEIRDNSLKLLCGRDPVPFLHLYERL